MTAKRKKDVTLLEAAICKWSLICYGVLEDEGPDNCPLCGEYLDYGCSGCPVSELTGSSGCDETPYEKWYLGRYKVGILAEEEVSFLCSLLPKKHRWFEEFLCRKGQHYYPWQAQD